MRRWLSFLLLVALVLTLMPAGAAYGAEEPREITAEDYAAVDALWEKLDTARQGALRAHRNPAQAIAAAVTESDIYEKGTISWQGSDHFTFETTVGVTCAWSARMQEIMENAVPYTGEELQSKETVEYGSSGGNVYVFQPYYGIDSSFTTQYQQRGKAIAEAIGGTYHLYSKNDATVDAIADAIEQGVAVIFDSHGDTDYARGEDYTTGATTSYLLLQTGNGLTEEDYAIDNGTYHAYYYGRYGSMYYYAVDGTCIRNHMEKTASHCLLWMAICLSMATDGLHKPLMEQGVDVAYGYSQSVTFGGDYCWEACFWENMCDGAMVKDAIATMKETYGEWDYNPKIYAANNWYRDEYYCATIADARRKRAAFPIVVSAEDAYPGHGNVDDLQTVYSTWTLQEQIIPNYSLTAETNDPVLGTVTQNDNTVTAIPAEGSYVAGWSLEPADAATVTQNGNEFTVSELRADCCLTVEFRALPQYTLSFSVPEGCTMDSISGYCGKTVPLTVPEGTAYGDAYAYTFLGWTFAPMEAGSEAPAYINDTYTFGESDQTLYALYTYRSRKQNFYTTVLKAKVCYAERFADLDLNAWYHESVDYVLAEEIMRGISEDLFDPNGELTRAMLATILYRLSGENGSEMQHPFADVAENTWYTDAVAWSYNCGVIKGVSETEFCPDQPVTREQAATMLCRYANALGMDVTPKGDVSQFRDAGEISGYAVDAMAWAVGEGILNGTGNGYLEPRGTATRAQIAKIIFYWLENE